MNADASGQFNLTKTPSPQSEVSPKFFPGSRTIAFSRYDGTQSTYG